MLEKKRKKDNVREREKASHRIERRETEKKRKRKNEL